MPTSTAHGPLVAGASDGVGAAFADGRAERGVNVVLVARRQALLDEVAFGITDRGGVQTRTLAIDLAGPDAAPQVAGATADLRRLEHSRGHLDSEEPEQRADFDGRRHDAQRRAELGIAGTQ